MTKAELEQRFEKCWREFCELYKKKNPRGADKAKMKKLTHDFKYSWARISENKKFWTESDIVRVLTNICAKEFKKDRLARANVRKISNYIKNPYLL